MNFNYHVIHSSHCQCAIIYIQLSIQINIWFDMIQVQTPNTDAHSKIMNLSFDIQFNSNVIWNHFWFAQCHLKFPRFERFIVQSQYNITSILLEFQNMEWKKSTEYVRQLQTLLTYCAKQMEQRMCVKSAKQMDVMVPFSTARSRYYLFFPLLLLSFCHPKYHWFGIRSYF